MYGNAVGFNPGKSLLSGLKSQGNVGAFAKGQAMQNAAGLNMDAAEKNQQMGMQAMQQESDLRQKGNQVQAQRAEHGIQEGLANEGFQNRREVFDTGMAYDNAQLFKQRQNHYLQSLINESARHF